MSYDLHPIPQPYEVIKKERNDATGAYMMMFITLSVGLPLPFINLLASWIYWLINKSKVPFVRFHMLQSLYSQLIITVVNMGAVFYFVRMFIFGLGNGSYLEILTIIIFVGVANLIYFIMSIIGATKANKGQMYYFPIIGSMSYQQAFKKSFQDDDRSIANYRRDQE